MKKFLILILLSFMIITVAEAQTLKATAVPGLIVYNGEGQYAIIIMLSPTKYNLQFKTSLDGDKSVIESLGKKPQGNSTEFTITVDAKKTKGAKLIVISDGYENLEIPINLNADQAVKYYIDDPLDPDTKTGAVRRKMRADRFFESSTPNYDKAKEEYEACLEEWDGTSEIDTILVNRRLNAIETIKTSIEQAEEAERTNNYAEMVKNITTAHNLNPNDKTIEKKFDNAGNLQRQQCREYTQKVDRLLEKKKDSKTTIDLLMKMSELGCTNDKPTGWVEDKIDEVNSWKNAFSRHTLTYEFGKGASVGLSSGNYNVGRTGGYFTLRFNSKIFEAIRLEDTDSLQAEANISFGFTIPVYHYDIASSSNIGLWAFVGPGMTMFADILPKSDTNGNREENYRFAISPEAGVLLKIPIPGVKKNQIALRYTFQYRFALKKEDIDLTGKNRNVFGIGITF